MLLSLTPQRSTIYYHDSESWIKFLVSRNSPLSLDGTYLPRNLVAHLNSNSPFLEINRFHEYNGHGGFCEHSRIGNRIVAYEKELESIEEQILRENEHTGRSQLTAVSVYYKQYLMLRRECDDFLRTHHNYYEGFAYWLEKHYSLVFGFGALYEQRKTHLDPFYLELVDSIERFVAENSVDTFLGMMSFE